MQKKYEDYERRLRADKETHEDLRRQLERDIERLNAENKTISDDLHRAKLYVNEIE